MAGAGYKSFTAGEVLEASEVNTYLMDQSIMVFAGTAERDSALGTAVSEGMHVYLTGDNSFLYYDGAAWQTQGGGGATGFENNFLLMGA